MSCTSNKLNPKAVSEEHPLMMEINKHRDAERGKQRLSKTEDIKVQNVRQDSLKPSSSFMEAHTGVTIQPGR
jgi:hypothetical protein